MPRSRKVWIFCLLLLAPLFSLRSARAATPAASESTVISLSSGVIDTSRPQPAIPEALSVRPGDTAEDEIVLVKFPAPPSRAQIAALRAASLEVYETVRILIEAADASTARLVEAAVDDVKVTQQ
jgi:hypothetical protein